MATSSEIVTYAALLSLKDDALLKYPQAGLFRVSGGISSISCHTKGLGFYHHLIGQCHLCSALIARRNDYCVFFYLNTVNFEE